MSQPERLSPKRILQPPRPMATFIKTEQVDRKTMQPGPHQTAGSWHSGWLLRSCRAPSFVQWTRRRCGVRRACAPGRQNEGIDCGNGNGNPQENNHQGSWFLEVATCCNYLYLDQSYWIIWATTYAILHSIEWRPNYDIRTYCYVSQFFKLVLYKFVRRETPKAMDDIFRSSSLQAMGLGPPPEPKPYWEAAWTQQQKSHQGEDEDGGTPKNKPPCPVVDSG